MRVDHHVHTPDLAEPIQHLWDLSAEKIHLIRKRLDIGRGSPVFTVEGRYTSRGWTEWTQGFLFGSALLQFEATGNNESLHWGRAGTHAHMPRHVTHFGVHDHGFNTISTYGNLWRMIKEGAIEDVDGEGERCSLAIRASAAVQARRWTKTRDGGFIHSFNGPHSLFVDTMRTLRVLLLGHALGHELLGENDESASLLERAIVHAHATARFNVYYGEGRDRYDLSGRTAHEAIFNVSDGRYRCPSSQQGYSAFTTWTRGLAWMICGAAEMLEFLWMLPDAELEPYGGRECVESPLLRAAEVTARFYMDNSSLDGIPYWDTGAPGLAAMDDWRDRPADPFNAYEPVDASAAAIAAQGLLRYGRHLQNRGDDAGRTFWFAGLSIARTLMAEPYLSDSPDHEGLLLHSVYHYPNGWDHVPEGQTVPCGESSMWGDYHLRELALYLNRAIEQKAYLSFFAPLETQRSS